MGGECEGSAGEAVEKRIENTEKTSRHNGIKFGLEGGNLRAGKNTTAAEKSREAKAAGRILEKST